MKKLVLALSSVLALALLAPDDADARTRGYRKKAVKSPYAARYRYYGRPASVGPNGLCQRDTGTPTGQLNFRNKCDTEEFWNRMIQGGRRR